jgi:peroxiredoxin
MPRFLIIAALLLLPSACYSGPDPGQSAGGGGGPATLKGAPAQSFDVSRTDGHRDSLARHRGQVVLMNLWATWCPPCQEEMPALQRFAQQNAGRVTVIGVDQGEAASVAADFAKRHGITFPILVDEKQQYGRAYAAVGLPTTVIIGRDGHVVRGIDGELTLAQMRDAVAPALAQK